MGDNPNLLPTESHRYDLLFMPPPQIWNSHKGRVSESLRTGKVAQVAQTIQNKRPALEILEGVIEAKKTVSDISATEVRLLEWRTQNI